MVSVSGAAVSDQFAMTKIQAPTLAQHTQEILKSKSPSCGMISNPVDVTANVVNGNEAFEAILLAVAEDVAIDMVLLCAPDDGWLP
jgi:acetate---CoA ligase (ADP-forming)